MNKLIWLWQLFLSLVNSSSFFIGFQNFKAVCRLLQCHGNGFVALDSSRHTCNIRMGECVFLSRLNVHEETHGSSANETEQFFHGRRCPAMQQPANCCLYCPRNLSVSQACPFFWLHSIFYNPYPRVLSCSEKQVIGFFFLVKHCGSNPVEFINNKHFFFKCIYYLCLCVVFVISFFFHS